MKNKEWVKEFKSAGVRIASQYILLALCVVLFCSGCSVFMAAKQPDKKNLDFFKVGTHRDLLVAEFGAPITSEIRDDGQKHEIFSFKQGYSTGVKTSRALFHGAADILTIGLWEVVGTPTESVFDGDKMVYSIRYDDKGLVDKVTVLQGD